jgi:hypothetical protein
MVQFASTQPQELAQQEVFPMELNVFPLKQLNAQVVPTSKMECVLVNLPQFVIKELGTDKLVFPAVKEAAQLVINGMEQLVSLYLAQSVKLDSLCKEQPVSEVNLQHALLEHSMELFV